MVSIGKAIILFGILLVLIGAGVYLAGKLNLPLGHLPGDIRIERENFALYFPLGTMILLSVLLTVGINLILRLLNRK